MKIIGFLKVAKLLLLLIISLMTEQTVENIVIY